MKVPYFRWAAIIMAIISFGIAAFFADREHFDMETWDEKITDTLNYLFLLRAIVEEGKQHE